MEPKEIGGGVFVQRDDHGQVIISRDTGDLTQAVNAVYLTSPQQLALVDFIAHPQANEDGTRWRVIETNRTDTTRYAVQSSHNADRWRDDAYFTDESQAVDHMNALKHPKVVAK